MVEGPVEIASNYALKAKHWQRTEFEVKMVHNDGQIAVVNINHADDKSLRVPGGGKSIQVEIDIVQKRVVRELGFQ